MPIVYHKKAIATTGNIAAAYARIHAAQSKGGYFFAGNKHQDLCNLLPSHSPVF